MGRSRDDALPHAESTDGVPNGDDATGGHVADIGSGLAVGQAVRCWPVTKEVCLTTGADLGARLLDEELVRLGTGKVMRLHLHEGRAAGKHQTLAVGHEVAIWSGRREE